MSSVAAIPYFTVSGGSGPIVFQPFGLMALAALALAVVTTVVLGNRRGIPGADLGLIVPIAVFATVFGAHFFDVAWYRWGDAERDPKLWLRFHEGISVFGGMAGAALAVFAIGRLKKASLAIWADVAALGFILGLAIGRIGCTLVHDHPGIPTDSPIGVDFPAERARWALETLPADGGGFWSPPHDQTIRLHDVGFEELLLLIPVVIAGFVLIRKRLKHGVVAVALAISYAVIRLPLDFLRTAKTEPTRLGLTGGQWGCLGLLAFAGLGIYILTRPTTNLPPARTV